MHTVLSDEETESESGLKSDEEEIFDERYFAYSAVLDMDITSFLYPKVLCETSSSSSPVLMKQVPSTTSSALSFMDTLWASTLEPWVHYVPLKQDWSDLKEQIEYVLDPQNAQQMNAIVQKGKQWCQTYMVRPYSKVHSRSRLSHLVGSLRIDRFLCFILIVIILHAPRQNNR